MPSSWINYYQRVSICIDITIYPARQPNRIRLHIPANACAAIPVSVLVRVRFRIKILPRQPQVDLRCRSIVYPRLAKGFILGFPCHLACLVQRQERCFQMVCRRLLSGWFYRSALPARWGRCCIGYLLVRLHPPRLLWLVADGG